MRAWWSILLAVGLFPLLGCSPNGEALVDVTSDLAPVAELSLIETALLRSTSIVASVSYAVTPTDSLERGVRVAEISVDPGPYTLRVRARGPGGNVLLEHLRSITVNGRTGLTVRFDEACVAVTCPSAGEPLTHTACSRGRCVVPACLEDPARCETDAGPDSSVMDSGLLDGSGPDGRIRDGSIVDSDARVRDGGVVDSGVPCACALATDSCWIGIIPRGCTRNELVCNAVTPCPDDYRCSGERCLCEDTNLCGITCMSSDDCAYSYVCDAATNRCRAPLKCFTDLGCDSSEFCSGSRFGGHCLPRGATALSGSCTQDTDCAGGYCLTGLCVQSCLRSSECATGFECRGDDTFLRSSRHACLPERSECAACSRDQACQWPTWACRPGPCATTNDCAADETCMGGRDRYERNCSSPRRCEGEEVLYRTSMAPESCVLPRGCWLGTDTCPTGYSCEESDGFEDTRSGLGLCSRPAD